MGRIILKISGEALKDEKEIVSKNKLEIILKIINLLAARDYHIAIVIGGGNFFRGRENPHMEEITRDTIGMIGTVLNALYIKDYLEKNDYKTIISTPFSFPSLIENLSDEELKKRYDEGSIIIFGGGIGKSGFSTDSGVVMAREKLDSDLIIKMTNVDGIYNDDPKINKNAQKFDKITYQEIIDNNYAIMDIDAIKKCQELKTKILVMNLLDYEKLNNYFDGEVIGTEVSDEFA